MEQNVEIVPRGTVRRTEYIKKEVFVMENSNSNTEILVVTENEAEKNLSAAGMARYGIKFTDAKTARKNLLKDNVEAAKNLSDDMAIALAGVRNEMKIADKRSIKISLTLAAIRSKIPYEKDANGKFYGVKGESRFIKEMFSDFARSSLTNYMNVGTKIYLPIINEKPGYEGLTDLLDLSPSVLKEVVSCFESQSGIDFIAGKLAKVKALPTAKVMGEWKREYKEKTGEKNAEKTLPDGVSPTTEDETNGNKFKAAFLKAFNIECHDGELYISVYSKDLKDAYKMITDAAQSKEGAQLFMTYLSDVVKRVTNGLDLSDK